jgi:hypothetical protein
MSEKETPLGRARRAHEAEARTAWEPNYRGAINEARRGKVTRLTQLLIARRPLDDADFDLLAAFLRDKFRKPGGQLKDLPHRVALLALALKDAGIKDYCKAALDAIMREVDEPVDRDAILEAALTLIRNPERLGIKTAHKSHE